MKHLITKKAKVAVLKNNGVLISRYFVRFCEHDLNRTDDGIHQDIVVAHAVKHEQHEPNLKFNDIGIIHLERDVEFSGKTIFLYYDQFDCELNSYLSFYISTDKIRPICLPLNEPILSHQFVNANAFVAGIC